VSLAAHGGSTLVDQPTEQQGTVITASDVEVLDQHGRPVAEKRRSREHGAPVTIGIIALNILVFLVYNARTDVPPVQYAYFPAGGQTFPQVLTYMFVHGSATHIMVNLLAIFSFGMVVEQIYGSTRYLLIYLVTGMIAAVSQTLLVDNAALIGASGAATAILGIFVRHFPRAKVLFFFFLPMPAWVAVIVIIAVNVYGGLTGGIPGSVIVEPNIGYIPHLAGLFSGVLLSLLLIPPRRGWRFVVRSRRP
jgi:membrane associated rhomboid family serine protease